MAPGLGRVRFARWVSSQHRSTENAGGAVSAVPLKARRRGGFVLLTMSTPAPALVITTPTEVGGALAMLSEAESDRGVLSVPRRRAGALYPKLRPGPHCVAAAPAATTPNGHRQGRSAAHVGGSSSPERFQGGMRGPVAGTNPPGGPHRRTRAGVALTMSARRGIGNHE
jgi:hypothetical protein